MRVLLITGRYPVPGGRGDQVRAALDVAYLSEGHEVTVLATEPAPTPAAEERMADVAEIQVVTVSRLRRGLAVLGAALTGQPGQCGWMMPRAAWRRARRLAEDADVVLINTARCMRGPLPAPVALDHIDALSHNMRERSRGPEPLALRLLLRFEAWRMASWERRAASFASVQVAASHEVRDLLPPEPPVAILPNGWAGKIFRPNGSHKRDIDVIFTGHMRYPPNRQGAAWLLDDIMPGVRAERPETTAWIVGRDAAELKRPGVEVASDVEDLLVYTRRARVAVAPVFGAGSPSKTLEAAASGAALVSTPYGLECYGLPGAVAGDTDSFVTAILRLLDDEAARRAQVTRLQLALRELTPNRLAPRLEKVLEAAREGTEAEPILRPGRPGGHRAIQGMAAGLVICAVALTVVLAKSGGSSAKGSLITLALTKGKTVITLPVPYPRRCLPEPWPALRANRLSLPRPAPLDPARTYFVRLETNCGAIEIRLDVIGAPHAAANVANLVDHGVLDSTPFYRSAHGFLLQAGLRPLGVVSAVPRALDPPGPSPSRGTVAMFRTSADPVGASRSDFFIVTSPNPLPPRFAVLGHVTQGQAVVERIASIPTSPPHDGVPRLPVVINRADLIIR